MLNKIQQLIGINKSELISVVVIMIFTVCGYSIKNILNTDVELEKLKNIDTYNRLDSLANANQTTMIGNDNKGDGYTNLIQADTFVKKDLYYSFQNNKISKKTNIIKVNINSASKVELMQLPGIGEKTALKIIEYRKANKFQKAEDIMNIKGIGIKKFEKMKEFIKN